jgi:phage protein D
MLLPAYELQIGSVTINSTDDPTRSTLLALEVSLDLDTPADQAILTLAPVGGVQPALGNDVILKLGYSGSSLETVFTGTVADVQPGITANRILALSPAGLLLGLRTEKTYLNATAADIVRDLCDQAGVDIDSAEDGSRYAAYVCHGGRNAASHLRLLAQQNGFESYFTPQGKLVFRKFTGNITVHVLEYGKHLVDLQLTANPVFSGQVQVFGESPLDAQGDQAFAWLTKSFNAGVGGSGGPIRAVSEAALRTQNAARAAAQAAVKRYQQQDLTGRARVLGKPQIHLGQAVRFANAPDERMNATFQVRSIRHHFSKKTGFTTTLTFWSLGERAA